MPPEPFIQPRFYGPSGFGQLADGWLEGGGKAPKASNLEWLAAEMADHFPAIEFPSVVPTEEGNVVF